MKVGLSEREYEQMRRGMQLWEGVDEKTEKSGKRRMWNQGTIASGCGLLDNGTQLHCKITGGPPQAEGLIH